MKPVRQVLHVHRVSHFPLEGCVSRVAAAISPSGLTGDLFIEVHYRIQVRHPVAFGVGQRRVHIGLHLMPDLHLLFWALLAVVFVVAA